MKRYLTALLLMIPLWGFAAGEKPKPEERDARVINASLEYRRKWVIEQAEGPGAWLFSRDYEGVLAAESIGPKEANQLAYVFFYSTGVMGGYFERPVQEGDLFRFAFHPGLGRSEGLPVFVDSKTGFAWQEGQKEKIDTLSLIRLFTKHRKEEKKEPNQSSQPTRGKAPRG